MRLCTRCKERPRNSVSKTNTWCRQCQTEYCRSWRAANPDKEAARRARGMAQRERCKREVYDHYGNVCACCGEANLIFLTVEHLNGGGARHRRTMGASAIYVWLVNMHFPEGFEILCFNCNCGKYRNGGVCPHQEADCLACAGASAVHNHSRRLSSE